MLSQAITVRHHALSIDVEDWYHDVAVGEIATPESRVEQNTLHLLELLAEHGAHATFFFLGAVAERFPGLVRRVAAAGHEIGSHGYAHRPVSSLSRRELQADVARSLGVIGDALGEPVRAYRAPYFSIAAGEQWPLDVLRELGIHYDSSILATTGRPGFTLVSPRVPYQFDNGLWEIPVAVFKFGLVHYVPLASGAGLRWLPPALLDRWLRRFEQDVGAGLFYMHPWELDSESPTAAQLSRWFLRPGRRKFAARLRALMESVHFSSIQEVYRSARHTHGSPTDPETPADQQVRSIR
jgi:polysaccharide deacetylase family protein (PEP-CTERM system associated)